MQSFQCSPALLVCSATVPYCQIKKDYDDVVSPIFGPPGIQGDTKWVLHCVNSQRAVFKHCLFVASTKIFTKNFYDLPRISMTYVLVQKYPKISCQKIKIPFFTIVLNLPKIPLHYSDPKHHTRIASWCHKRQYD